MPQTATFGRRVVRPGTPPPTPAAPRPAPVDAPLDPRAEAFRAEIAAQGPAGASGFDQWLRGQAHRIWLARALTLISFLPGVVTLVLDAPIEVTVGLEIVALVGNVWVRRERYRRAREIVAWEEPANQ